MDKESGVVGKMLPSEQAMTPKEPDIYVERCSECPAHENADIDQMWCRVRDEEFIPRMGPWDRRFPRWCPLLKAPITIAARRKG